MARSWLTPDGSVPSESICLRIAVPNGLQWRASLRGALLLLAEERNWETFGSNTPEEVAAIFWDAFEAAEFGECEEPMSQPMVGEIRIWTAAAIPDGWLLCAGQILDREEFAALFAVIGTTYGAPAPTEFSLPNMSGRFPVQSGGMVGGIGTYGGEEEHTLTVNEMPAHNHIQQNKGAGGANTRTAIEGVGLNGTSENYGVTTLSTGGGLAHNNVPPYLSLRFIIYVGQGA